MDMNEKTKPRLTVTLPDDLHHWFRVYTVQRGVTMKEIITEFLEDLRHKEESTRDAKQEAQE